MGTFWLASSADSQPSSTGTESFILFFLHCLYFGSTLSFWWAGGSLSALSFLVTAFSYGLPLFGGKFFTSYSKIMRLDFGFRLLPLPLEIGLKQSTPRSSTTAEYFFCRLRRSHSRAHLIHSSASADHYQCVSVLLTEKQKSVQFSRFHKH